MDLPDELELPLERGAPYWYWLGARVALDYVNTLRERWRRRVETLVTPDDLAEWLVAAGLATAPVPVTPRRLREARELREAIDRGVSASIAHRDLPGETLAVINRLLGQAALPAELRYDEERGPVLGTRPPADPARHALGLIASDAAEMLTAPENARIRVCASSTCSARFYDRSPAAARQWCSPDGCGNRERARRHRSRQAPAG
jgi:predicted RNA-binding Zn ribbon-like protein